MQCLVCGHGPDPQHLRAQGGGAQQAARAGHRGRAGQLRPAKEDEDQVTSYIDNIYLVTELCRYLWNVALLTVSLIVVTLVLVSLLRKVCAVLYCTVL